MLKVGTYLRPKEITFNIEWHILMFPISNIFDLVLIISKVVLRLRGVLIKERLEDFKELIITNLSKWSDVVNC